MIDRLAPVSLLALLAGACSPAPSPSTPPPPPPDTASAAPSASAPPVAVKPPYESPGGMWMPEQLPEHAETLKKLGLELDPKTLADPMAYPLGAIVFLGGCSASFVSPDGLIATNHHCVTGYLQFNSKPGEDILKNGWLSKTRADERFAGPTARIFVTQAARDVSERMKSGLEAVKDDMARQLELEKRQKQILAECEKQPGIRCELASYFGGQQYLVIERLEIKDVRLVYAPDSGVGNFGGEVDNWRWPRHTGDFSFIRAYVGKDGKPADHAADNVPYHPKQHLRLASEPLHEGDLVMVAGYPAQTFRLAVGEEVKEAVAWFYPRRIRFCTEYSELIQELGKGDEDVRLKATPLRRGLDNTLTYTKGSLEGLTQGGTAASREKLERDLAQWIDADPARKAKWGDVLGKLAERFAARKQTREADAALDEILFMGRLLGGVHTIVRMAEERPKPDADRDPAYQERNWQRLEQAQQQLDKQYNPKLDRALLKRALMRGAALPVADRPAALAALIGKGELGEKAVDAALDGLYGKTKLEDATARIALLKQASLRDLRGSKDPFVKAALAIRPHTKAKEDRDKAFTGAFLLVRPRYVESLRAYRNTPIAPDANRTLRVTFGTVHGYRPRPDAQPYYPFTRLSEMVAKATGKDPFAAPDRVLAAARAGRFGGYLDATLGEVPVDFLTNLDITGGNSGSATLNARGELVGLAFDGNYEAMASDWLFMPELSRTIHVDFRYARWVMDAADGAEHLLAEMGVPASIP